MARFQLTKSNRKYLEEAVARWIGSGGPGILRDLLTEIQATRCVKCGGSGVEAYVGGDDDNDACLRCDGTGMEPQVDPAP